MCAHNFLTDNSENRTSKVLCLPKTVFESLSLSFYSTSSQNLLSSVSVFLLPACFFGSTFPCNFCMISTRSLSGLHLIKVSIHTVFRKQLLVVPSSSIPFSVSTRILFAFRIVESLCAITNVVRFFARRSSDCCTTFSLSLSNAPMSPRQRLGSWLFTRNPGHRQMLLLSS